MHIIYLFKSASFNPTRFTLQRFSAETMIVGRRRRVKEIAVNFHYQNKYTVWIVDNGRGGGGRGETDDGSSPRLAPSVVGALSQEK